MFYDKFIITDPKVIYFAFWSYQIQILLQRLIKIQNLNWDFELLKYISLY